MAHTPAYRARRKRMRDQRNFRRRLPAVGHLAITVSVDMREYCRQLEEARERLSSLFAIPPRLLPSDGATRERVDAD